MTTADVLRLPRRHWPALRRLLTALALAALVWFGVARPDWASIGDALGQASPPWIAAAALVNVVSLLTRGAGWVVCAGVALDRRPPWLRGEAAFQIGQAVNTVVPGRVGEPVKAYVLNARLRGDAEGFSALIGSVAVHRLMDVVPLATVSLIVIAFGDLDGGLRASVIATLVFSGVLIAVAARLATHRGGVARNRRLVELLDALRAGFMVLRRRGPLALAVALETAGWSVQIGVVWLGFQAFGIDAGPIAAGAVVIATNAATLVPLWPGNVGLVQLAVALALRPWGVPESEAIAFGLALQGAEMVSALGVGAVAMAVEGMGLRDLRLRSRAAAGAPREAAAGDSPGGGSLRG